MIKKRTTKLFLLSLLGLSFFIVEKVNAAISFEPQIPIPGFSGGAINSNSIGEYILAIYNYAIGSVGILATVVMMYAGVLWITAAGNQEQIGKAKAYIASSLTGLVIAFCSWTILWTVNPDLLTMRGINMEKVSEKTKEQEKIYGCCEPMGEDGNAFETTHEMCTGSFYPDYEERYGECRENQTAQKENGLRDILSRRTGSLLTVNKEGCSNADQTDCTNVAGLPPRAISGMIAITNNVKVPVVLTGGAEAGHRTHGIGNPVIDLRICSARNCDGSGSGRNSALEKYIQDHANGGNQLTTDSFYNFSDGTLIFRVLRERITDHSGTHEHYHISFN